MRIALLDLTSDRMSQRLLRQLPVDARIGALGPERTAEPVRAAIDLEVLQEPPEHGRSGPPSPGCRGAPDLDPDPLSIGLLQDHERSAGEGAPRSSLRALVRVPVPHRPPHYEWNLNTAPPFHSYRLHRSIPPTRHPFLRPVVPPRNEERPGRITRPGRAGSDPGVCRTSCGTAFPSSLHSSFHVRAGVAPGRVDPCGKAQSPDRPLRPLLVGGCRDRLTPGGRPPRPRQVAAPSPAKQRYADERCELRRGPVRPDPRCPLVWLLARDKSAATPEDSRKVFGSAVVAPSSGRWQNAPMSDPDRRHLFAALVYVAAVAVGMLAAWRFAGPLLARFADAVVQMLDRWLPT